MFDEKPVVLTDDKRRERFRQLVGEALTTLGDAGTDRDQFDAIQLALRPLWDQSSERVIHRCDGNPAKEVLPSLA